LTLTNNEFLIGVAFGITALVQAALTIPFGFWSDKYGRKKMIIIGLIFFIIGSLLAAHPFDNIYILIFARFIQGISAIYSCVLAFISDTIPDRKRTRTMSMFSIFTGVVFSIGIILGPTISPLFLPYSFLFIISAILASIALIYLIIFIPEPPRKTNRIEKFSNSSLFKDAFFDRNLIIIYSATFLSSFVLISILFLLVPIMLENFIPIEYSGLLLIPIFIVGMIVMIYTSKLADKGYKKQIALIGFGLVCAGLAILLVAELVVIIIGLLLFFTGMAILDPLLPTLILKLASKKSKGTSSGIYNLTRYFGEGIGPIVAGLLLFILSKHILLILLIILVLFGIVLINNLEIGKKNR
jgi:MFS family permease